MSNSKKDNVKPGDKFNRFTVISLPFHKYNGYQNTLHIKCMCDCGIEKEMVLYPVINGVIKSCGCLKKEVDIKKCRTLGLDSKIHGISKTKIYKAWSHMMSKCYFSYDKQYKDYGGRGISVCEEWKNDVMNFYNWSINNGWKADLSIDRIDNNGNYEPNNCRWVDKFIQANNKRNNIFITAFHETKTIAEWSKDNRCLVNYKTLYARIKRGLKPEQAISQQLNKNQFI